MQRDPARSPLLLWLGALALQLGRALWLPEPDLWDVHYYRAVARSVAEGEGALTGAVWSLASPPPALPAVADLYWMPLPSRALVPGLWLWPERGELLMTALLASLWAPLAWALARGLGASGRVALGAGVAAALGGAWARQMVLPDCFGIVGALGGLGMLAVVQGRAAPAALCALLLALCRGEGALLGLGLAAGFTGWRRWAVAAAGPLGSALWALRNLSVAGPEALAIKAATTRARDISELLLGTMPKSLGGLERLQLLMDQLPGLALFWLSTGGLLAVLAVLAGLKEAGPLRRPLLLIWLLVPPLTVLAAPGAAAQGALYRTGAALGPVLAAVGALGAARLGAWGARARGYPPAFLPGLLLGALVLLSAQVSRVPPSGALPPDLCVPLQGLPAGAPVFAWNPLAVAERCGHPAVALLRGATPAQMAQLAARYRVHHALLPPPGQAREDLAGPEDMARLLPGWVSDGSLLWVAPGLEPEGIQFMSQDQ